MSQQRNAERPSDFDTMQLPHTMQPIHNPNFLLQCHEAENLPLVGSDPDDSETRLIFFLDAFEDGPEDNSHTNSQGSVDNQRGGSIEAHLRTAQRMAPDSLAAQYEVNAPKYYCPLTVGALRNALFPPTHTAAFPVLALHNSAVNHLDYAQDLFDNPNSMDFQVGLDAPATSSSSTDYSRMQGMSSLDFLDSPQPWVRPAGSSNEADTYHVPNNRTCASRSDHQENMDHSRGIPGQAPEVKQSVVGSRGVTAATKARRKDQSQPGRFLCTLCGADITANHNLTNHMNSHYGIKNNQCVDCGKFFATRYSLKRHGDTCKASVLA